MLSFSRLHWLQILLSTCAVSTNAQPPDLETQDELAAQLSGRAAPTQTRELKVLSPTLAPEELDRAVLDRLMQEIANKPETAASTLAVDETQLQNIFITLSNAKSFINNNEMANIRAMCSAWNKSTAQGDERIEHALSAYRQRRQFTLEFIQRYYGIVIKDIETSLNEYSKLKFTQYMHDRRRRMSNAGNAYSAAIATNVRSGTESVHFHCGTPRQDKDQEQ